jgi:arylsulfatase A-like enzyme
VVDALRDLRQKGAKVTLVVTTDHGRDRTAYGHGPAIPESGRVWLIAWGDGIVSHGVVASPRPRYLIDIAPTVRTLAGLDPDTRPGAGRVLSELVTEEP